MIISVVNRTTSLSDEEVQTAIRAINRQIECDFAPYWNFGATLRLEGPAGKRSNSRYLSDMRGDAVLYLLQGTTAADAYGWHEKNYRDIPFGFVMLELCLQLTEETGEEWTTAFSHEALELLGDPLLNLLAQGPHPLRRKDMVFHMFEMCDAVQAQNYFIDDVQVSNFVLPSYFTVGEQDSRRNDFLGSKVGGKRLHSFGISPGGYVTLYDPHTRRWSSPELPDDNAATRRKKLKKQMGAGRSYRRLQKR